MAITKRTRFEVFKRDSFKCQYCGRSAPEVLLEADHVEPRTKGGSDDILNLLTACIDCNRGKSDRRILDDSVIEKQKKQLQDLQKRREQLDMMFQWQKSLLGIQDDTVEKLSDFWCELTDYTFSDVGKKMFKKLLSKFTIGELMEAMTKADNQYCDGTQEKNAYALNKVGSICRWKDMDQETRDVYYIRAIIRNRGLYINESYCVPLIRQCIKAGASVNSLKDHAKDARSWTAWREGMETFLDELKNGEETADAQ